MIKIFIEAGKPSTSEYVFIKTLVTRILDIDSGKFKIECVDGKDNLVIVFDADFPANKGGFKVRQEFFFFLTIMMTVILNICWNS